MRFLIILGFLLGFGGVLTAAVVAPFGAQERIRSRTSVANNGGRLETFIVRLPADRIMSTAAGITGPLANDPAARIMPPAALEQAEFAVEQYKLRNVAGDVVGTASRHWTRADGEAASTWAVSIPSRGTLVWTSQGNTPAELANTLAAVGVQSGIGWQGEFEFAVDRNGRTGNIVTGTEEFADTSGRVEEIWSISSVGGSGELSGTITLNTVVNQSS